MNIARPVAVKSRLEQLFLQAVAAADPAACLAGHWPALPAGRLVVLAAGKCATGMAEAAVGHYGDSIEGLVVAPDGHGGATALPPRLRLLCASHPLPDERSVAAADAALDLATGLGPEDLLLVMLSGGGSSLLCRPAPGLSLATKQLLAERLLNSGAPISEINCVRKQLSAIKGGRLSAACKAPVVTLAVSDVPGDHPALIASGPTVADDSSPAQALRILDRYGIDPGEALLEVWRRRDRTEVAPDPGRYAVVASGRTLLEAAERALTADGYAVTNLGDQVEGEARELAMAHAQLAVNLGGKKGRHAILSGGEATVTIRSGAGSGGRNTEYLLALALALEGRSRIAAIAADSDGIDGRGRHAGAVLTVDTLHTARQLGLTPGDYLAAHDSATFFESVGGLVVTGPTLTNVNDFRLILIG